MPSSPSSSAQAARLRLGEQLRLVRQQARVTGVQFAELAGWRKSSLVSMIERGQRTITADHVRLWCRICEVPEPRTEELLAEQRAVARMWIAFRELGRQTGLNATQKMLSGDMWERVSLYRCYQTKVIPGLLQTPGYMTGVLVGVREERGVEVDDVAEAVAERLGRQRWLRTRKRFMFVVEESVLRFRPFGVDAHREQLEHLMTAMRLPSVSLGIIPLDADRGGYRPRESFDVTDDTLVTIELLSGFLSLTHPDEITAYVSAWARLLALAVHGDPARALITAAAEAL